MDEIRRELKGHSGSKVFLIEKKNGNLLVRKVDNVQRNYERMVALKNTTRIPYIYHYQGNVLDMEYIPGLDMQSYLIHHPVEPLIKFIEDFISKVNHFGQFNIVNYTTVYEEALVDLPPVFPFTVKDLVSKAPKYLPITQYHGDMTLENIIYGNDGNFYFIDPVTTPYTSYIFDLAKLRQDLDCHWFLRHNPAPNLIPKLVTIKEAIFSKYDPEWEGSDYLLILMLLRVFRHCEKDSMEYDFIRREIWKLWK
jgi:hypothetical protein